MALTSKDVVTYRRDDHVAMAVSYIQENMPAGEQGQIRIMAATVIFIFVGSRRKIFFGFLIIDPGNE